MVTDAEAVEARRCGRCGSEFESRRSPLWWRRRHNGSATPSRKRAPDEGCAFDSRRLLFVLWPRVLAQDDPSPALRPVRGASGSGADGSASGLEPRGRRIETGLPDLIQRRLFGRTPGSDPGEAGSTPAAGMIWRICPRSAYGRTPRFERGGSRFESGRGCCIPHPRPLSRSGEAHCGRGEHCG